MREACVLFGEPKTLVGVVTDPEAASNGIAVLFLNAGYTHRVGPQRLYVRFARKLSPLGFTSFRFDHAGIGDSRRRADSLPFPDSAIKDVQDAMDFLQSTRGIRSFVVAGICWGADNAVRVAAVDSRVTGVIAIDFYSVPSMRNLLRTYSRRLLVGRSWLNLARGRSLILGRVWGLIRDAARAATERSHGDDDALPSLPPQVVIATLREMALRGVHLCFAYASEAMSYDQYALRFRKGMRDLERAGLISVRVFHAADHLFTLRYNQVQLWSYVEEWTRKLVQRRAAASDAPAAEPVASVE